jgi:hypothetical protein
MQTNKNTKIKNETLYVKKRKIKRKNKNSLEMLQQLARKG